MTYEYSFSVWPDEECQRWHRETFDLFRMLNMRVTFELTQQQFGDFREKLAQNGFSLREIERVPHNTPETVL